LVAHIEGETQAVSENRVLRRIVGPKKNREWRRLHPGKLYALFCDRYYLGEQIKKTEMDWACGTYWKQERCTDWSRGET
jgi:hypothetical protein